MKANKKGEIGRTGEDLACRYLEGKGFEVIGRNYRKPWGEIDIICEKTRILHFIEVKSVTRENLTSISRESAKDQYRPEDNIHPWKLKRLSRVIQTYLLDMNVSEDHDWQFDVITVYIDPSKKQAKVFMMEDLIL